MNKINKSDHYKIFEGILGITFSILLVLIYRIGYLNRISIAVLIINSILLLINNIFGVILWNKDRNKCRWEVWVHKGVYGKVNLVASISFLLAVGSILWK